MAAEQFAHGYALIIAVDQNLMPGYALPTVARDAAALREVLVHPERCAYPAGQVRLLSGSDATRDGIHAGLSWLKERLAADRSGNATAVLYYSGHGVVNRTDGAYYFLPYDVSFPVVDSLLRASDLAAEIELVRPRRLLVMLDCCHAGGMGIKGDDPLAGQGLAKAAAPPAARPVVALMQGQGRAVLSSSTAEESSYVRSDRKMSIFTYHLIEALTGHARPPDGGDAAEVLVSDVMGYVSRRVPQSARTEYNVSQTPVYDVSGENFPVALLLGGAGVAKGQPPPDPLAALPPAGATQVTHVANSGGINLVNSPVTAGRDVNLKTVAGNETNYILSGDFTGAVVHVGSYFALITTSLSAGPRGDEATRATLGGLIATLRGELEQVGPDEAKQAETVARKLADVTAALAEGDDEMAPIHGRAFERAAAALAGARPAVPTLARQINALIARQMAQ